MKMFVLNVLKLNIGNWMNKVVSANVLMGIKKISLIRFVRNVFIITKNAS